MKGLPLTYNRDLQEDKEGFFDTVDTLLATLKVFQGMLSDLQLDTDRVTSLAGESYMLATDLADYLVGKGVPFREAHGVMRELCRYCEDQGKDLQSITLEEYQRFSPKFDQDVFDITALSSVSARDNPGGTAPGRVAEALRQARELLREDWDGR
jgi:argininosuccinate lyase